MFGAGTQVHAQMTLSAEMEGSTWGRRMKGVKKASVMMDNVQIILENNKGLILKCALLPSSAHTMNCKVFVDHYCANMRFYSILSQVFSNNNPSFYISQLDFHLCGTIWWK